MIYFDKEQTAMIKLWAAAVAVKMSVIMSIDQMRQGPGGREMRE